MLNVNFEGGATVFEYGEKESPGLARIRARQPEILKRAEALRRMYGDPVEGLAKLLGSLGVSDEEWEQEAEMTDDFQSSTLYEAYFDRNQAVMVLARLAEKAGHRVGIRTDPDDPDWPILVVTLPTGQISWHLPREELIGTWEEAPAWDGHDLRTKRARMTCFLQELK